MPIRRHTSAYIRKNLITVYHPVGTAKMSFDSDTTGVTVLRVKGIKGVRVVDASIFVRITNPLLFLFQN
ncbi:hypothetical protein K435DRAFT_658110 [Dendrothele bispora CBS 962.96]|uniref:Glucose-methanol-choline oxidoreductase C-terminal domain-containing protein n=1 Tax=Dendrothele bispora (strain CBS 962.96) TaxID=1314807 RepID=A0A4S8MD10_DENBC|nr:hypothetical protein K435DRAFT_658110 [Dendrothele bispora CBS 962.96]